MKICKQWKSIPYQSHTSHFHILSKIALFCTHIVLYLLFTILSDILSKLLNLKSIFYVVPPKKSVHGMYITYKYIQITIM